MWDEMVLYMNNINKPFKLYVNLVDGFYTAEIVDKIKNYKGDSIITFSDNKGVDIGGFLNVYPYVDEDTDLVLKIHTKKSIGLPNKPSDMVNVYGLENATQKGRDWFEKNMGGILKDSKFVNDIVERFINDEKCGLIGHNLETYVGPNDFIVKELIKSFGLNSDVYGSPFIDGTMFWVRNDILKKY
jgi:lipopolysaccharide biosynthesis protein